MCNSNVGSCYQQNSHPWQWSSTCCRNSGNSSYAIILVLFILLVIVIGSRCNNSR